MSWCISLRVTMCAVFCLFSQARVRWVLQSITLNTASLWNYMPRFKTKQNKKTKLEAAYQSELFSFFPSKYQIKIFLKLLNVSILNIHGHTYLVISYSLWMDKKQAKAAYYSWLQCTYHKCSNVLLLPSMKLNTFVFKIIFCPVLAPPHSQHTKPLVLKIKRGNT